MVRKAPYWLRVIRPLEFARKLPPKRFWPRPDPATSFSSLTLGETRPAPAVLALLFHYVPEIAVLGCQWKELPIEKDDKGCENSPTPASGARFRRIVCTRLYGTLGCHFNLTTSVQPGRSVR